MRLTKCNEDSRKKKHFIFIHEISLIKTCSDQSNNCVNPKLNNYGNEEETAVNVIIALDILRVVFFIILLFQISIYFFFKKFLLNLFIYISIEFSSLLAENSERIKSAKKKKEAKIFQLVQGLQR